MSFDIKNIFKKNTIQDFIRTDLQFYIFLLVVVLIPFHKRLLPYIMFLWVMSGVISIRRIKFGELKNQLLLLFPFIFYGLHIIGLFYSNNLNFGLKNLEIKLSILFIPIVGVFINNRVARNFNNLLRVYIFANFIVSIICLINALNNSLSIDELGKVIFNSSAWPDLTLSYNFWELVKLRFSYFSYNYLSIFHHPSYYSLYILFSIAALIYLIRSSNGKLAGYYILIAYFSVFIWLLGSRAAFLTYIILFFSFLLMLIIKFRRYWIAFTVFLLGIVLTFFVFSKDQINRNLKEVINLTENKELTQDGDIRFKLWKAGFDVFEENLWFGVGTGDVNQELQKKYEKYNLKEAKEHNYNAHNQYLDTAIKTGVIGLSILLLWIFYALYISIKNRQFLFFYFMLIMSINFLFEVMLNSIAGVAFFTFFYALLYSKYNRRAIPETY